MVELERRAKRIAAILVAPLVRAGITANQVTLAGFVAALPVALLLAMDWLIVGGIFLLLVSALDMMDGAVARARGEITKFGAFLDSTLDRYVEAAYYGGLIWRFLQHDNDLAVIACFTVLAGSIMVSYARARAEGLGLDGKVGILQRPERLILLGIALLFGDFLLIPMLWIMAVVTNLTVVQRLLYVRAQTRGE
ncbi:MAG TPA: CDP-alcohol phosphatidyltransferase family protein [Chloroflexota bacterium]|nr:CDP-alcohol phosphatidyltransferase family protein [Chloroflexota bacterium]